MKKKCDICGKSDVSDMNRHLWDSHGVYADSDKKKSCINCEEPKEKEIEKNIEEED